MSSPDPGGKPRGLLLILVDGVGLAAGDAHRNPLAAARLPTISGLLGGARPVLDALPEDGVLVGPGATLGGLDACLGVEGLPQSGTGHASLLTGENAAAAFGRHFGPWVPTVLRASVRHRNVLSRAVASGFRVAFANAYPRSLIDLMEDTLAEEGSAEPIAGPAGAPGRPQTDGRGRGKLPIPCRVGAVLAAAGSGALTRDVEHLRRGEAVASEITNRGWRAHLGDSRIPELDEAGAGANLARIAAAHDLTFFAHYATDTAGHRRSLDDGVAAIERVDALLGGAVRAGLRGPALVVGDHGNLEDVAAGHTRNAALCLALGAGHEELARELRSITDVTGSLLRRLGAGHPGSSTAF